MMSLLRIGLALALALTVCVAGWAGLHALGLQSPAYASGTPQLTEPDAGTPVVPAPLPPAPTRALGEAPAGTKLPCGSAEIAVQGSLLWPETDLLVRSTWSRAEVRRVPLRDPLTPMTLAGLPIGGHEVSLVPRAAGMGDSYFAKVALQVHSDQPARVGITLVGGALEVVVRGAGGEPLANVALRIERVDDPRWRAPHADAQPKLTDAKGIAAFRPLGAGRYRVHAEGSSQEVDVPAQGRVELRVATR